MADLSSGMGEEFKAKGEGCVCARGGIAGERKGEGVEAPIGSAAAGREGAVSVATAAPFLLSLASEPRREALCDMPIRRPTRNMQAATALSTRL